MKVRVIIARTVKNANPVVSPLTTKSKYSLFTFKTSDTAERDYENISHGTDRL